jgi:hypothetical protein
VRVCVSRHPVVEKKGEGGALCVCVFVSASVWVGVAHTRTRTHQRPRTDSGTRRAHVVGRFPPKSFDDLPFWDKSTHTRTHRHTGTYTIHAAPVPPPPPPPCPCACVPPSRVAACARASLLRLYVSLWARPVRTRWGIRQGERTRQQEFRHPIKGSWVVCVHARERERETEKKNASRGRARWRGAPERPRGGRRAGRRRRRRTGAGWSAPGPCRSRAPRRSGSARWARPRWRR